MPPKSTTEKQGKAATKARDGSPAGRKVSNEERVINIALPSSSAKVAYAAAAVVTPVAQVQAAMRAGLERLPGADATTVPRVGRTAALAAAVFVDTITNLQIEEIIDGKEGTKGFTESDVLSAAAKNGVVAMLHADLAARTAQAVSLGALARSAVVGVKRSAPFEPLIEADSDGGDTFTRFPFEDDAIVPYESDDEVAEKRRAEYKGAIAKAKRRVKRAKKTSNGGEVKESSGEADGAAPHGRRGVRADGKEIVHEGPKGVVKIPSAEKTSSQKKGKAAK